MKGDPKLERIRWIFTLAALVILFLGLYAIFHPFFVPLAWAGIFVLSTWSIHTRLRSALGDRGVLAATIMTLSLSVILLAAVVPLLLAVAGEIESITIGVSDALTDEEFVLPLSLTRLPVLGPSIETRFLELRDEREKVIELLEDYQLVIIQFVTIAAKGIFWGVAKILMCILAAFFLYLHGSTLGSQLTTALYGIGGEQFGRLLSAVKDTIRGAVYGVIVTAVVQGLLAGLGYYFAGAPVPLLLGAITIITSLIPFGPPVIYVPVILFLGFGENDWTSALLLSAWCVGVVSTVDNFIRPYFISQTTRMPILLVFMGAIGGVLAFGVLGLFIGPALLAIAQVLWREWIEHQEHAAPA